MIWVLVNGSEFIVRDGKWGVVSVGVEGEGFGVEGHSMWKE